MSKELIDSYKERQKLIKLMSDAWDTWEYFTTMVAQQEHEKKQMLILLEEAYERRDDREYDAIDAALESCQSG